MVAVNRAQVDNCLNSWRDLMEVYPKLQWEKDYGVRRDIERPQPADRAL